jgi:hypothetical protein
MSEDTITQLSKELATSGGRLAELEAALRVERAAALDRSWMESVERIDSALSAPAVPPSTAHRRIAAYITAMADMRAYFTENPNVGLILDDLEERVAVLSAAPPTVNVTMTKHAPSCGVNATGHRCTCEPTGQPATATMKEHCPRRLMGETVPPHMPCDTGDFSRDAAPLKDGGK